MMLVILTFIWEEGSEYKKLETSTVQQNFLWQKCFVSSLSNTVATSDVPIEYLKGG